MNNGQNSHPDSESNRAKPNMDEEELAKFERIAHQWWDPEGPFRPLHALNPLRLTFIRESGSLAGTRVLDVGCGGGLLAEAMAAEGAHVTGIDASAGALEAARAHLALRRLKVDYLETTVEQFAATTTELYDRVVCMELLEHVPDPAALIRACAQLLHPGGTLIVSTINRNLKAYLQAILAAEYLLAMLPRGTHDYRKFIRPSELAGWGRRAGLHLQALRGMGYHPLRGYFLRGDPSVNYLARLSHPEL